MSTNELNFMGGGLEATQEQLKDIATDKPKAGRPEGSTKPDDMKKTIIIQTRVSKSEAEIIRKAANKSGCAGISHFLRMAVNDKMDQMGMYE